jgi:uncharacterized protein with HEPN domain
MHRDMAYLVDILEAAKMAREYVKGLDEESFLDEFLVQDAVVRRLEIVGEAARRLSDETRAAIPGLPWQSMIAMRNILIHQYDNVDLPIVWDTVKNDLPTIIATLEPIVPPPMDEEGTEA